MFTQLDSRSPQMLKAVQPASSSNAVIGAGKSTKTRK